MTTSHFHSRRRRRQLCSHGPEWSLCINVWLLLLCVVWLCHGAAAFSSSSSVAASIIPKSTILSSSSSVSSVSSLSMIKRLSPREEEIKRKILQLKRQGRILPPGREQLENDNDDDDGNQDDDDTTKKTIMWSPGAPTDYSKKLQNKLGARKSQYMGFETIQEEEINEELNDDDDDDDGNSLNITPTLGSLSSSKTTNDDNIWIPLTNTTTVAAATPSSFTSSTSSSSEPINAKKKLIINPDLFDQETAKDQLSEKDLIELVAQKLNENRRRQYEMEQQEKQQRRLHQQQQQQETVSIASAPSSWSSSTFSSSSSTTTTTSSSSTTDYYITSGIGGNWNKNESVSAKDDLYVPSSSGSWGAFPRPRDISKAFGGGRQVTPGGSATTTTTSTEDATRERLRQYRERVGIEVQSEKDHALEIEEALQIASYAMQRGVYATAVSVLEKVTKYCSTNSKIGGKVFLELAMAYEAVGRSGEAMTVYRTLSTCRIEDIKFNAKRLLYGMEAMQFMREEAKNADFSRKKIRNTFIDTTGLANIAQQFDDVYQTAYIDLNSNFYRKLTESVVRSNREARQILLKATGSGEVERLKIVQALRSLSRNFETALEKEIRTTQPKPEPVAWMNGKPIVPDRLLRADDDDDDRDLNKVMNSVDEFALTSAEQMMENLHGEWRLQLIADRRGDGVKYFNSSLSWQLVDTGAMTFQSSGNLGFITMSQSGDIEFDETRRVLKRNQVRSSGGGGMLTSIFVANPKDGGVIGAICSPQQIMSVDSILLVTQCAVGTTQSKSNADRDHFAVWRRVEAGTYSKNART